MTRSTASGTAYLRRRLRENRDLPSPEERRAIREAAGLSTGDLARAVGVTRGAISYWERGRRSPRGDRLARYLAALREIRDAA